HLACSEQYITERRQELDELAPIVVLGERPRARPIRIIRSRQVLQRLLVSPEREVAPSERSVYPLDANALPFGVEFTRLLEQDRCLRVPTPVEVPEGTPDHAARSRPC